MKVKLSVHERLMLPLLLPKEGNYLTLKTAHDAHNTVVLTDDEQDELELKINDNGNITWNGEKAKDKEIELTARAMVMISDELKKLDKEEKLTAQHMTLYDKFVDDEEADK